MWIQDTAKGTKDGGKILFWGWLAPSLCKHSDVSKNSNVRLFSLICSSIFSNFATSLLSRIAFSGNGPHFAVNWGKIISFLPFYTFYLLQCKSSTVWLLSELNNVLLLHSIVLYCRPIAWWEISVDFLVAIYKRLMLQQLSAAPCWDIYYNDNRLSHITLKTEEEKTDTSSRNWVLRLAETLRMTCHLLHAPWSLCCNLLLASVYNDDIGYHRKP